MKVTINKLLQSGKINNCITLCKQAKREEYRQQQREREEEEIQQRKMSQREKVTH